MCNQIITKIEQNLRKYSRGCWVWEGKLRADRPDLTVRIGGEPVRINVREFLFGVENGIFPPTRVYRTCLNCRCCNPRHHTTIKPSRAEMERAETPNDFETSPAIHPDANPHNPTEKGFGVPKNTKHSS